MFNLNRRFRVVGITISPAVLSSDKRRSITPCAHALYKLQLSQKEDTNVQLNLPAPTASAKSKLYNHQ